MLTLERTVAFDDSAGIATTITVLTVKAHNAVLTPVTRRRRVPTVEPEPLVDRPCICPSPTGA